MIVPVAKKELIGKVLNDVILKTALLKSTSPSVCSRQCTVIERDLVKLRNYTEECIMFGEKEVEEKEHNRLDMEKKIVSLLQKQMKNIQHNSRINAEISNLNGLSKNLDKQISSLNSEIFFLEAKIEREQTLRNDAVVDWIPGVGLIGGLITGRYKRMIPLYSTIAGIVSCLIQEKETLQAKREKIIREQEDIVIKLSVETNRKAIAVAERLSIESEIFLLQIHLYENEELKKELSQKLTFLKNLLTRLRTEIQKQKLLISDVKTVRHLMNTDVFEIEVVELHKKLEAIKDTFKGLQLCP